jgi:hypothetical protein
MAIDAEFNIFWKHVLLCPSSLDAYFLKTLITKHLTYNLQKLMISKVVILDMAQEQEGHVII